MKKLQDVLDGFITERSEFTGIPKENLCADKGYFGGSALEIIVLNEYIFHDVSRDEKK